jgi:hypothetical protein
VLSHSLFSILPRSSRCTQLNLYGFRRLLKGRDKGGYYHECFLRFRPQLLRSIHRIQYKGTTHRAKSNLDGEPNFYEMPFMQPCSSTSLPDAVKEVETTPLLSAVDPQLLYLASLQLASQHRLREQSRQAEAIGLLGRVSFTGLPSIADSGFVHQPFPLQLLTPPLVAFPPGMPMGNNLLAIDRAVRMAESLRSSAIYGTRQNWLGL